MPRKSIAIKIVISFKFTKFPMVVAGVLIAFKYRIYPKPKQERLLKSHLPDIQIFDEKIHRGTVDVLNVGTHFRCQLGGGYKTLNPR